MATPNDAPDSVDYDTFMTGDLQSRIRTFNEVSAENRAALISTHIRRWIAANRQRLSAEQMSMTDEWLRCVTPEAYAYTSDKSEDARTKLKDLEARTAALFSREDMGQALTIHARHIPQMEQAE